MGTSHNHDYSSFPRRMPRNTFSAEMVIVFSEMVAMKATCTEIKMMNNVLCCKDVFQNAIRKARADAKADQARVVRDTVNKSTIWSSEVHLNSSNVFVEAFFVNSVLSAKRLKVEFVYVDDTSCSNDFYLPVISVLCRDMSNTVHSVAWGVLKNRTMETFTRFFSFVARHFPSITTFMCDRHYAQHKAITIVFGDSVNIFHCCVHIARNIANNVGPNTLLTKQFWESATPARESLKPSSWQHWREFTVRRGRCSQHI